MVTSDPTERPAVLAVFAHPDDEQFGTSGALLRCVDRGVSVYVLCATRGDAGQVSDPALASAETLGAVREGELREASRLLGFAEPIVLDYKDGHLAQAEPGELTSRIAAAIRSIRPRVVVTFDANGGYGHPDHVAIHRATLAAVVAAANIGPGTDGLAVAGHRPDKLYATAYPRSSLARLNADLVSHGFPALDFGDVQGIPAEEIGTVDEWVTTVVPVDDLWPRRWASFRAHRTQYGPGNPFIELPEPVVRSWMAVDTFVRLDPPPSPGASLPDEDDLWAGLPLPD
ncbi:MAG TPA: PIG-L family deacetylase [Thermomicrobiales bacterium]|nr:PIG-L family deacetylase [Thermomicrobiales bacterium]